MRSLPLFFTAHTKSLLVLRPSALARAWRFYCRSQRRVVHLVYFGFSGWREVGIRNSAELDLIIHCSPDLRRSGHDRVFSSFSERWSAFCCPGNPCGRRGHHGHRGDLVFPRSTVVAANRRRCVCDHWFVFAANSRDSEFAITVLEQSNYSI